MLAVLTQVGDILCGDGIIVQSHNMKINESSLTGESDDLSKGRDYVFLDGKVSTNPFVYSGTQVTNLTYVCPQPNHRVQTQSTPSVYAGTALRASPNRTASTMSCVTLSLLGWFA